MEGVTVGVGTGSGSGTGVGVALGEGLGDGVGVGVGVCCALRGPDNPTVGVVKCDAIPIHTRIISIANIVLRSRFIRSSCPCRVH
ncbi:MAG: hypothetical protein DMF73_09145 [Acidobacteria bacterium]|nr:MAG: hypothetical protein DMF73_09145 [Acidobacteriota bacterium]